jgi:uncharacterized membrane protein YccC
MSAATATGATWLAVSLPEISWRNAAFSVRTAVAAIASLAVAYAFELQDPQWAVVTVYLIAQPTAGASLAKGFNRILGTLVGAVYGLAVLALYAQAPVPFVAAMSLWFGLAIYLAARLRNFTSYGALLAGWTALLVGYEGAADPTGAWQIAVDRTAEIVIGILFSALAGATIFPRYAGDDLRASLAATFSNLARFGATALHPGTPFPVFVAMRRQMIADVVRFDALRSYTAFEAPERRADDLALRRTVREFLRLLAIARALYLRLEDFRAADAGAVLERLQPVLMATAGELETIAALPNALADPHLVRRRLLALRAALGRISVELENLSGSAPPEPLANAVLVARRTGDMIHALSMVMVTEAISLRPPPPGSSRHSHLTLPTVDHRGAVLQGVRAGLVLLVASVFWAASEWTAGFSAITGLAIMNFVSVNQEEPGRMGWPYFWAVLGALVAAFLTMLFVLPRLEDFGALALYIALLLVPAGLFIGTPRWAMPGAGFCAFFVAYAFTGNRFVPDVAGFVNGGFGLVVGMLACLAIAALLPLDSGRIRLSAFAAAMRALPTAARGERPERAVGADILASLAALLPRLDLSRERDEVVLRGLLGAASSSLELARLHREAANQSMPDEARAAVAACLDTLGDLYPRLADSRSDAGATASAAEAALASARARLDGLALAPGSAAARSVVRAAASLRFLADRFGLDRSFYLRAFTGA